MTDKFRIFNRKEIVESVTTRHEVIKTNIDDMVNEASNNPHPLHIFYNTL